MKKINFNELLSKTLTYKYVVKSIDWLKHIVLPGFSGVPLYDAIVYFIKGLIKGKLSIRASALSYNFFMALFPFILFLFTIIAYLPIDSYVPLAYDFIKTAFPEQAQSMILKTIDGLLKKNGTLLSVSAISVFFFATRGVRAMIATFNGTYHTLETRNGVMQYITAVWLSLVLIVMIIFVMTISIASSQVLKLIMAKNLLRPFWWALLLSVSKWLLILVAIYVAISLIYYFAPAKRKDFKFLSAGSSLSTVLIALASGGFNYYISHFSRYNAIYGSIGALIIVLLWIQLLSMIILIGFELNASISNAKQQETVKLLNR